MHSNKIQNFINDRNRNLFVVSTMALSSLLLGGCGQRGSLYIPNTPEAAQRSTIGDVLTNKPANPATNPGAAPHSAPTTTPETAPAK